MRPCGPPPPPYNKLPPGTGIKTSPFTSYGFHFYIVYTCRHGPCLYNAVCSRTPRQFLREVKGELRKVAWPTREEVRNYSIIVLIAVVVFTTFVALLDYGFGVAVLWLYDR